MAGDLSKIEWKITKVYTTSCWTRSLKQYLHKNNIKLQKNFPKLQTLCGGDKYIMEEAVRLGYRKAKQEFIHLK